MSNPAFAAIFEAQRLAFAPVAFQVAKVARDRGILKALQAGGKAGCTVEEVIDATGLTKYAVDTLLEAGSSFGLCEHEDGRYTISRTGYNIENDPMTRVNMDFVHDVCYQGMFHLDEAIAEGRPAGLKVFGDWSTVYEGLAQLPEPAKTSWLRFDHYYSDSAFPEALPIVFADKPAKLLDVGGNTGRFSIECCRFDPDVAITILDLPGQLAMMRDNIAKHGFAERVTGHPIEMLDHDDAFPFGHDAIWMSQFLCCFSMADITGILRRARAAMDDDTTLWILDTYWDRQRNEAASYCLHGTSVYFTAMANGNSRMYSAVHMLECIAAAELTVVEQTDHLGHGHTLLKCVRSNP